MKFLAFFTFIFASHAALASEPVRVTFQGRVAQELSIYMENAGSDNLNCSRRLDVRSPRSRGGAIVSSCFFEVAHLRVKRGEQGLNTIFFMGDAANEIAHIANSSQSRNLKCRMSRNQQAVCALTVENLVITGLDGTTHPSVVIRN